MRGASTVKRVAVYSERLPTCSTQKTGATAEARTRKRRFYKPLAKEFQHEGFTYRKIARQGHAAIYEQRWTGCAEPSRSWEVIRVKCREGFEINGRFVEPAKVYPKSKAWGTDAFTFTDKEAAFEKLTEICR